jgi:uncharacterized protein involved in response to NO
MIFSFGSLVVLSHTGRAALLSGPLRPIKLVGLLTLAAAAARVSADFNPDRYKAILHLSSGLWVTGALVWLGYTLAARAPKAAHG